MPARLDSVARHVCERGGWAVSNLRLQKLLYLAQMTHLGRTGGERLVDADFQAWDYGPVVPQLYSRLRMFGSNPVKGVFYTARPFRDEDPRRRILDGVCDAYLPLSAWQLVGLTHRPDGAWARTYVPGLRGLVIPDRDIAAEYGRRADDARGGHDVPSAGSERCA